ncbi:hypothetical protein [Bounagaea algeriensis]
MTARALPVRVPAQEAVDLCARRAPRAQVADAELHYHPFVAVAFDVIRTRRGLFRRRASGTSPSRRVHALVDAVGGRTYLTEPWPELERHDGFPGPSGDITTVEAVRRATAAVSTQLLRGRRLLDPGVLQQAGVIDRVWKPNWVVPLVHRGRQLRVLVDGMNGSYYVSS